MTFFSHRLLLSLFYLLGARGPHSLPQTALLPNFLPNYLFHSLLLRFHHLQSFFLRPRGGKLYCQNGHGRISPSGSATVSDKRKTNWKRKLASSLNVNRDVRSSKMTSSQVVHHRISVFQFASAAYSPSASLASRAFASTTVTSSTTIGGWDSKTNTDKDSKSTSLPIRE